MKEAHQDIHVCESGAFSGPAWHGTASWVLQGEHNWQGWELEKALAQLPQLPQLHASYMQMLSRTHLVQAGSLQPHFSYTSARSAPWQTWRSECRLWALHRDAFIFNW